MTGLRRGLAALLVAVVGGAGSSCSSGGSSDQDAATRLGHIDGVARVASLPYDDGDGRFLRLTLAPHLPDAKVREVVDAVKSDGDDHDLPSVEIDADGFVGSIFPEHVGDDEDKDLDRALWVRRDGRATAYVPMFESRVSSHWVVIAPAPDVAQLALDVDAAEPDSERSTKSVESSDGTTGVQWSTSYEAATSSQSGLDRDAVRYLADLQNRFPGTTGWIDDDGEGVKAAVDFDPDEVGLDDLRANKGFLVDSSHFTALALGWGIARAPGATFAKVFGRTDNRRVLQRLRRIPGVTEFAPGDGEVTVRDAAAYVGVRRLATRRHWNPRIALRRTPVLYDEPIDPVFESDADVTAPLAALLTAAAELDGVRHVDVADRGASGNLTIEPTIDDRQLTAMLTALADLPRWYRTTQLFVTRRGDYGSEDVSGVGVLSRRRFVSVVRQPQDVAALLARVHKVWAHVSS